MLAVAASGAEQKERGLWGQVGINLFLLQEKPALPIVNLLTNFNLSRIQAAHQLI